MFDVRWTKKARKCYQKLDSDSQARFEKLLDILETSPSYYGKCIKRLTGELEGLYRFRIGKLRIFYVIDIENKTVIITNIDSRGDAY